MKAMASVGAAALVVTLAAALHAAEAPLVGLDAADAPQPTTPNIIFVLTAVT